MPRNSSGIFSPPAGTAAVSNTTIQSAPYNNLVSDIGNEITNSLPTTGVKAMGANLPMGGNRATGAADPTQPQDLATKNYVDTTTAPIAFGTRFVGGTSTGTANAQVLATTTPNTFALTAGNEVVFNPGFTPTGATTLQVGGTAAKNVLKPSPTGPVALVGGEFVASQETSVIYDGTQYVLNLSSGAILTPTLFTDSGPFELTGAISPAPSGTVNDWAPAGIQTAAVVRANLGGAMTLNGIAAPTSNNGRILILENVSAANILTLMPENTGSVAANRLTLPAPITISPAISVTLIYDTASSRWRLANPVVAAPTAVARKNLKIVTTSITAATITADELILEDSLGMTFRATTVSVSYATGTSGANGLDTGSIAASTWYFEWVICNASTGTVASLISLSSTAPTMPAGYTFKARVGASYFDAGSKLRFKVQYDRVAQVVLGTNPTIPPVIASGAQGTYSSTSPVLASVSLAAFVPSTASKVKLYVYMAWKGGASANIMVAPSTAYGGTNQGVSGSNGLVAPIFIGNASFVGETIELILESLAFGLTSDNTGGVVALGGWEENL